MFLVALLVLGMRLKRVQLVNCRQAAIFVAISNKKALKR